MTSRPASPLARVRNTVAASCLLALTTCKPAPQPAPPPASLRMSAAPAFTAPVDSLSRALIVAYARGLTYDTAKAVSDAQYLVIAQAGRLVVGPYAQVAPEVGAAANTREALGRGRIIGRITLDAAYSPQGLSAGTSYVWVDSVAGSFRMVFVPDSTGPMTSRPLTFHPHPSGDSMPYRSAARITESRVVGFESTCWLCLVTLWCTDGGPGGVAAKVDTLVARPE